MIMQLMRWVFFFCSFNDVNHNLYVKHLLFPEGSDVERDGAQPFQLVMPMNPQSLDTPAAAEG